MSVAVVTDSTACLPEEVCAAESVTVVPLHVTVGGVGSVDAREITPSEVAAMLGGKEKISTSRPSPGEFAEVYRRLVEGGARQIVSVHLSEGVSGTVEAARIGAVEVEADLGTVEDPVEIVVVDTRSVGLCAGYAALAAAQAAAGGASAKEVADRARAVAEGATVWFYVHTLEHLRRGGRIGTAAALLGSALAIKPILTVRDGQVALAERVRTRGKALARLVDLAAAAAEAQGGGARVGVHHLAAAEGAAELAATLAERTGAAVDVVELDPVISVHAGPGTLGVVVAPHLG